MMYRIETHHNTDEVASDPTITIQFRDIDWSAFVSLRADIEHVIEESQAKVRLMQQQKSDSVEAMKMSIRQRPLK